MFWDNLPLDLRVYILSIRYDIRSKSSEIISKSWRKYIIADNLAIDLALELQVDQEGYLSFNFYRAEIKTGLQV